MNGTHYLDPHPSGKPIVLLLHGLGAEGNSWTLQMPALGQAGYRPIAPDVAGFGESAYDGQGWNMQRVAAQMAGLLKQVGNEPAHVVGLSMGGVIAQQLALDFPQLVRKLVLVSTFCVLRPEDVKGWFYFARRATALTARGKDAQAQIVAWHVFPNPDDRVLREMYITSVTSADPRAYRRAMVCLGTFDSRKRLKEIQSPTLVITGEDDSTISPARQKKLVEGIRGARQVVIPKAGHAVSVDQAEQFNRVLLEFLMG